MGFKLPHTAFYLTFDCKVVGGPSQLGERSSLMAVCVGYDGRVICWLLKSSFSDPVKDCPTTTVT